MGRMKYYGSLLLSLILLIIPLGSLMAWLITKENMYLIGVLVGTVIFLIALKPLQKMRVEGRQAVEYDEFGRSKTKGKYEYLSKKEREEIDLQKTRDMERIMSSSTLKKMTHEGPANPREEIDKLIGLKPVKDKMFEMIARMKFETEEYQKKKKKAKSKKEKAELLKDRLSGRHMVFYGSPGTGKTTVARILTSFLHEYGYIKENKCIEINGNFLKAGDMTATKTELVIREAFGGVLFIDEAYSLQEGDEKVGREAIATLIKQMEDYRDRFVVILAGYTRPMEILLSQNPGFKSRVKEYLDFPDFNNDEMIEIFNMMAKKENFTATSRGLYNLSERLEKERSLPSFGNARTVRNILDEAIDKHALNLAQGLINEDERYLLKDIDISTELKQDNFNL